MAAKQKQPRSFGVLLYPDFEVLDIAGPIEALNCLVRSPGITDLTFSYIARSKDPVVPGPDINDGFRGRQVYLPTHTFDDAPQLDVLIVGGGGGAFKELKEESHFIRRVYAGTDGHQKLHSLISVCNGSGIIAQSGILDGHCATGNKDSWAKNTAYGPRTHWVAKARWVQSDNIWTTSGVSAGTDGMLAWMETVYGADLVDKIVGSMEYIRAPSADDDPFAGRFGCKDVLPKQ